MYNRIEYLKLRVFWDFKDLISKDKPLTEEDVRRMCLPIESLPTEIKMLIDVLRDRIDEFCVIEKTNGVYVEYPIYLASSRGIKLEIVSNGKVKVLINDFDLTQIFSSVEVKFIRAEELNRVVYVVTNNNKIDVGWFNYAIKMIYYPSENKLVIK